MVRASARMVPLKTQIGSSTSTSDGTRLDVAVDSFWASRIERAFFDLRVSTHFHLSNQQSQLLSCYLKHENIKNGMYDQRIREVEQATFISQILTSTGGLGH